jgi:hypothetical protein
MTAIIALCMNEERLDGSKVAASVVETNAAGDDGGEFMAGFREC